VSSSPAGPSNPKVDLVTTDGFLHPRRTLEERGLMGRKGFPVASDRPGEARVFVSDFFDFGLYVDAPEPDIRRWYVERFLLLRATAFKEPQSYFHRYASLSDARSRADGRNDLGHDQRAEPSREHLADP
jgi:type I pantothenate kinase